LNGVGGNTIEEAQQNISLNEFMSWLAYRKKRGSLHVGMRVEYGSALLATLYANSKSKRPYKIWDFMQHDEEKPISIEQAMETWH
jgi:hypothetical protein